MDKKIRLVMGLSVLLIANQSFAQLGSNVADKNFDNPHGLTIERKKVSAEEMKQSLQEKVNKTKEEMSQKYGYDPQKVEARLLAQRQAKQVQSLEVIKQTSETSSAIIPGAENHLKK